MNWKENLTAWAEEGLITTDQVAAITEFETGRTRASQTSRGVEALAYLGATLVLVSLFLLGVELWGELEDWGKLTISLIVTAVLFGVGLVFGRSGEPAVNRAQTFAWFLATAGVALSAFVLINGVFSLDGQGAGFWVALVTFAAATSMWLARRSALQMVALAGSAGATVVLLLARFENMPTWGFGVSFAALGVVWLLLTWGGLFTPERTSYALGSLGLLFIAFPESSDMPWPILGLLAALALVGLSVRLKETVLLGLGVAGLFVYVPMTIFELFSDSIGAIAALLITGIVLLGIVVGVVRLRRT